MAPPDFVIVGTPKSGTTSLYHYLKQHPKVFMPEKKEPHFFGNDLPEALIKQNNFEDYQAIYDGAAPDQICGEGSVHYTYSKVALDKLQEHNPDVKCIMIIRHPVDMFLSWHNQLYKTLDEQIEDPEAAWNAQESRSKGEDILETCRYPAFLQYRKVCAIGEQLQRLVDKVPDMRRMVIFYEDYKKDTTATYQQVLQFIGVSEFQPDFTILNKRAVPKYRTLERFLRHPPFLIVKLSGFIRPYLHMLNIRPKSWIRAVNNKPLEKAPVSNGFRRELIEAFEPEIKKVEDIMGRDLKHWREVS